MATRPAAPAPARATVPVWDRAVRVIHWALALTCAAAWVTTETGLRWHEPLGYAALALVGARFVWGFAGSRYARFTQFMRGPRATLRYAAQVRRGDAPRHLGHNPLGGWMIVALLTLLLTIGLSGWLSTTDRYWGVAWVANVHLWSAYALLALIPLHVAGAIHASIVHRENLVAAMIHGRKRPAERGDIDL